MIDEKTTRDVLAEMRLRLGADTRFYIGNDKAVMVKRKDYASLLDFAEAALSDVEQLAALECHCGIQPVGICGYGQPPVTCGPCRARRALAALRDGGDDE